MSLGPVRRAVSVAHPVRAPRRACLALVSALALLPLGALGAQELPVSVVGLRVRVRTVTHAGWLVGTALAQTRDSLVLEPSGADPATLTVTAQEMVALEVHQGRRRHWLPGAAIGAVVGSVGPFIWARATFCDASGRGDGSCGGADFVLAAVGFGTGALLGAGIGALVRSDRWVALPDFATQGPADHTRSGGALPMTTQPHTR